MRPALLTLAQLAGFGIYMAGMGCWAVLFFSMFGRL